MKLTKTLFALIASAAFATSAFAGNLTYEAPAEAAVVLPPIVQPGSMAGSEGWIIPLLAIGLIALAVSQNQDDESPPKDDDDDCWAKTYDGCW